MNGYVLKQDAIDTIMGQPPDAHYPSWYATQIEELPPADVVQVVRCQNCKHHTYDETFSSFWCEYPGRVRDTTPDGFCEKGEE